jgi:hypothetical protein
VWPPPEEVPVLPAAAAPQPDSGPDWMIEAPATAPAPVERTPIARQVTEKVPGRPVAPTAPEAGLDWVIEAPPDEPQKR